MRLKLGTGPLRATVLLTLIALIGCDGNSAPQANFVAPTKRIEQPAALPAMRWGAGAERDAWTKVAMRALEAEGVTLLSTIPADVAAFCPAYAEQDQETRKHFWAGLLSSLAKHESSFNPAASGGGGRYLGLMQISPATARHYGCDGAMLDASNNLSCAVRIATRNVTRDGAIVSIGGNSWRGIARDWMPLRSPAKRADIAGWTSQQRYCNG